MLGKKFVSLRDENNFDLWFVALDRSFRYTRLSTVRRFHLWTRHCNCRVLLKRAGPQDEDLGEDEAEE